MGNFWFWGDFYVVKEFILFKKIYKVFNFFFVECFVKLRWM